MGKHKKKSFEESPVSVLFKNHQKTITINQDMVGETVSYITLSGAIIAYEHLLFDYRVRLIGVMNDNLDADHENSITDVIELIKKLER